MELIWLALTGLVAGVLGGMLGIGGSVIMIPAMVWILGAKAADGAEQIHQYQAAAMIVNFIVALPALPGHLRARAVWKEIWAWVAPSALVGILIGVQLSMLFRGSTAAYLRCMVGVIFLYVAGQNLWRMLPRQQREGLPREAVAALPAWRKLAVGLPMGLLAGLLGIGGGALAVPAQQILLRMPLRNAIATSVAAMATISWLGATMKNMELGSHGSVVRSLELVAALGPTALVGAVLGSHLTHRLNVQIVRGIFAALMLVAAAKLFGWF